MRLRLIPIFFWLGTLPVLAQLPSNPIGINPAGLRWRQIRTDRVQVIFPEGLDSTGQRVANLVHYLWDQQSPSIGAKRIPVTMLLQSQSVISNGLVTPGPFRSELYPMSPQNNQATDWIDGLVIHEYRHVQQFANTRQGITGLVKSVLGSWPWGGMFGAALPRWYFEGDATVMETALTRTGRGRLPTFDMEYRSLVYNGINYGYEKAAAGSLRDFVPDWYSLGYYLTGHARRAYGADIWTGVTRDAVRFRGLFFPFSRSLRKRTGLGTPQLYEAAYRELDSLWTPDKTAKARLLAEGDPVAVRPKPTVTNYNNAHFLPDGLIVAEKRGFDRIPAYVVIGSGGEETLLTSPGVLFNPDETTLSAQGNRLCWAELAFDLRWRNRTFSVVKTYDRTTGEKRRITTGTRLFSPALSHGGNRIAAVEATEDLHYYLVILDAQTGEVQQRLANPGNYFYAYPRWTDDDRSLVVVANRKEAGALQLIDLASGKSRDLTPPTNYPVSHPFPHGDRVFFTGAYSGTNNIYAVNLQSGQTHQLTDVLTGAAQPSVSADGRQLLFSLFTTTGYELRRLNLDEADWRPVDLAAIPFSMTYFEPLVEQEGSGSIVGQVPNRQFEVRKFNKWSGIINPHSLLPYVEHPIYGLQVLSDNKFSTLSASAGAFFNVNEREWTYIGDLSYAELFPVINAGFRRSNRSALLFNFAPVTDSTVVQTAYIENWRENNLAAGLALPLNFSAGNAVTQLNLRADYHYLTIDTDNGFASDNNGRDTFRVRNRRDFQQFILPPISDGTLNAIDLNATFVSYRRQALQHVNPRAGLVVGLRYRRTFAGGDLEGSNFLARADAYLPGFLRTHSFFINSMYQQQDLLSNYRFSDVFVYPRGYNSQIGDHFYKVGINYRLPLLYPDWAVGPVAFLKRIKATAFCDIGWFRFNEPFDAWRRIGSAGLELTVDFRAFRLLEIDAGARYSYLFDPQYGPNGSRHQFDFLLISISE